MPVFLSLTVFAQSADPGRECFDALDSNPDLQILKGKVVLGSLSSQSIEMLANDKKSTPAEKLALAKWDSLREPCNRISQDWRQSHYAPNVNAIMDKMFSDFKAALADLYAGKISYGQFAKIRQANGDKAKAEAANINQQNQSQNAQNQLQQQQLNQQAQQANAQNQIQRQALANQFINNNKLIQTPFVPITPNLQAPTNTNCRMIGSTMNCTSY